MTRTQKVAEALIKRLQREQAELERKGFVRSVTLTAFIDQKTGKVYSTDYSCVERVLD